MNAPIMATMQNQKATQGVVVTGMPTSELWPAVQVLHCRYRE